MTNTIVTIGREYGSGGRVIARRLAEALGVPFYDKALIEMAARESGLSETFIREAEQHKTGSFLYNLYFSSQNLPISDQVFMAESQIIKRLAAEGPCVLVGRCADYVLRDAPRCVHAFVHAPVQSRVRRAREEYGIAGTEDQVRSYILKRDKARASYYNYFTTGRWGDCRSYHLAVNSDLGEEAALQILRVAAGEEDINERKH